ncbi:seminal metalloprotease 1-like [Panulirus ornatus]|uniref:seminal metalloprotease 1-like n=1 Tax=Panulirus ornatus TaxID=150431 RepID=UPI003A84C211
MKYTTLIFCFVVSLVATLVHPTESKTNWKSKDLLADAKGRSRPAAKMLKKRWPNNTVHIRFVADFPEKYRRQVRAAMAALNDLTCLTIKEAPNPKTYAIKVDWKERACFAFRGYAKFAKGMQIINLHPICFGDRLGTVIHELIHAIAFDHQHVRVDRDKYLTIHKDRISKENFSNFKRSSGKYDFLWTLGLPYDFNSVMHYGVKSFSTGKENTITLKQKFPGEVGQKSGPSRSDIAAINRLYECRNHYLGEDIPGALRYKHFHAAYLAKKPKVSSALRKWRKKIKT